MSKVTIEIDEEYKVDIDQYCHTLYHYNKGGVMIEKGKYQGQLTKAKWEEVGYFPNMAQVLRKVVFLKSLDGVYISNSLEEYISKMEAIYKAFENKDFKISESD